MYVGFHITEHRGDGSQSTFKFEDGSGGAFVESFDNDSLIHTDLSKGSYTPDGAPGWTLVRESAERYVLTRADGTTYVYHGYHAPWRQSESPLAGRLLQVTDRNGNQLNLSYNGAGQLTRIDGTHGRYLTMTWTDGRITDVSDHAERQVTYTYEGGLLTGTTAKDQPTMTYGYGAGHRLTSHAGGPAGRITYEYDDAGRVTRAGGARYLYESGKTTYVDAESYEWVFTLDGQQRVTGMTDPLKRETVTTSLAPDPFFSLNLHLSSIFKVQRNGLTDHRRL